MPKPKTHVMSLRLSNDGNALLDASAEAKGISKAAVIELAIRLYAEQNGIRSPQPPPAPPSD